MNQAVPRSTLESSPPAAGWVATGDGREEGEGMSKEYAMGVGLRRALRSSDGLEEKGLDDVSASR